MARSLDAPGLPSTVTSEPSPTAPAQAFPLPETIARFVIKQRLGSGAFGTVYRATDPVLGREVALKVPQPGLLESPNAAERFLREARAAAQLRHPNIVTLFETGLDRGEYYLATEFIEGSTLSEAVSEAGLDPRRAAEVAAALAEAVQFAHAQGIVHRDVKPSNVMLDRQGQPHLMDFGLARSRERGEKLTQDGAILGTPAYMAPEQARGERDQTTAASDQYSLGVTLYEMLRADPLQRAAGDRDLQPGTTTRRPAGDQARNPARSGNDLPQGDGQGAGPRYAGVPGAG